MKLNFSPDEVAFIDFETQSECDLKTHTARQYAMHKSTKVLTCVVKVDTMYIKMGPYLSAEDLTTLRKVSDSRVLVAHNAPFDSRIWELTLGLPEVEWYDTLPCARAAGLPGQLDKLGTTLFGHGKDPNGKRLIDMLCIVRNGRVPAVGPAHQLLMDYNVRDVELLEQVYNYVDGFGEPDVMRVDHIINERGIPVDKEYLERLHELMLQCRDESQDEFQQMTGVNPSSNKQMMEWLAGQGIETRVTDKFGVTKASISKPAVLAFLSRPEEFFIGDDPPAAIELVQNVLLKRQEIVTVGPKKVEKALSLIDADGRIRDQLVYCAAGPGRWSSRGLQVHNMPSTVGGSSDVKSMPLTMDGVNNTLTALFNETGRRTTAAAILSTAIRSAVRAPCLSVADYAGVEARCGAWLADETTMLSLYADPTKSLYLEMGRRVFGRPIDKKKDFMEYQLAKSIILGCGYGMGGGTFTYTLALRDVPTTPLKAAGLTPADCVKMYREEYPEMPVMWKAYDAAVKAAIECGEARTHHVTFSRVGKDLHAVLPSGRPIVYRNVRIAMMVPAYCRIYGFAEKAMPTVVYDHPRGYGGFLYGGKTCENVDQGMCRDIMANALVNCEDAGLNPVLHIHDEIVSEKDCLDEMLIIMSTPPGWAAGFPLLVEGYSGPIWTKNPIDYVQKSALNGRIL